MATLESIAEVDHQPAAKLGQVPGALGSGIDRPALFARTMAPAAVPLTTLEYRVVGSALRVTPAAVSVPKGIAGSVFVELIGVAPPGDVFVAATLRGPAFPARRLIGQVNAPLLLPAIPLVGDYELDDIRLVDALTGATLMEGSPSSVPVHIFDDILISRVTSRPLTLQEIQDRGIFIDDANFRAVEFEVGFVLDGNIVPVKFPVVAPTFSQSRKSSRPPN